VTARARNFSPWNAWMQELAGVRDADPVPVDDLDEAFAAWRERTAARVRALLGPIPDPVPLDVEIDDGVDAGAYVRHRAVFDSEATMSVPAHLLVPHGRSSPGSAVLAIHGHGPGKDAICALPTEEDASLGGTYAHDLALAGHVVLAPDLRCFGERLDWNPDDHYACDTNLVHAVMMGRSPLAANLWDLSRCLDVLAGHPLVDPTRIAAVGFSYGATCTLFLAALDGRVAAAVVSGYLSSWAEAHKMPWNMCGSQVMYGMLGELEHVDVAALIAPRPLLVETADEDLLFPLATARATVAALRRVYDHLGTPTALEHETFAGTHQWGGAVVERFLARAQGAP
jgi:dienelactone hydrolase